MYNNVFIHWKPFVGYMVAVGYMDFRLEGGDLIFYDKEGSEYNVTLEYGCGFMLPIKDIEFNIRKKVNFTRNEMFAIRKPKRNKYDEPNNVNFYIPLTAVDFNVNGEVEEEGERLIHTYDEVEFNAEYFRTWDDQPHERMVVKKSNGIDRLKVRVYKRMRYNDEWKNAMETAHRINETCNTNLSPSDVQKIIKHYKLVEI